MMAREYSFVISALASLTTVPFVQLSTPATTGVELIELYLGQETSETSEQLCVSIQRRSTASTLPTATTSVPISSNDPASLLTGSTTTNAQGIATVTGTAGNVLTRLTFNALNNLIWVPVPEARISMAPSSFLTLQFIASPATGTWSGHLIFRELT
jgi:hypothetical protein